MITPAQLSAIETCAEAAQGQRELRCQFAMAGIYQAAGLLPAALEIPAGPRDAARWANRSLFREWLEGPGAAYFEEVRGWDEPAAGDLLCFRFGHFEHHVAIQLGGGRVVHAVPIHGIRIAPCIPAPWRKRIGSVWRLVAQPSGS